MKNPPFVAGSGFNFTDETNRYSPSLALPLNRKLAARKNEVTEL